MGDRKAPNPPPTGSRRTQMNEHHGIILGEQYSDKLHGFTGTATTFAYYLNGCHRVCLQTLAGGELKETWFDAVQLHGYTESSETNPGGPERSVPPSRNAH